MPPNHSNLVISFVGDESVHPTWLAGDEPRRFDLALIYYGSSPGRYADQADFYLAKKGFKYWLLKELAETKLRDLLASYERFWLPDDDVAADTQRVNRLFDLFQQHDLSIAQPAIDNGAVSYESLRVDRRFEVRYSGYAEVMCPMFTRASLERCLPTFHDSRSSWGLDWLWSSRFPRRRVAVIDAVAVDHTRPLATGCLYRQLAAQGVSPDDEFRAIRRRHLLYNRAYRKAIKHGTARMRGVLADGTVGWNRPLLGGWLRRSVA